MGRTALHEAASNGHLAVVHVLLAHGANVNITDNVSSMLLCCIEQFLYFVQFVFCIYKGIYCSEDLY